MNRVRTLWIAITPEKRLYQMNDRNASASSWSIGMFAGGFGFLLFLGVVAMLPQIGPVFRVNHIPSGSMAPNFPVGSFAVSNLAAYGYSRYSFEWFRLPMEGRVFGSLPARGDVVVFRLPAGNSVSTYISRVAGLPGDRIQMIGGRLHLNGNAVQRERLADFRLQSFGESSQVVRWRETLPAGTDYEIIELEGDKGLLDNTAEFLVPDGHVFVLGDNRDNSNDSRSPAANGGIGMVPVEQIGGKVVGSFASGNGN